MPFATDYMSENHFAPIPVAVYCFDLLMCAVSYSILVTQLIGHHGRDSDFAKAIGNDTKGRISLCLYMVAIPLAFVKPWLSILAVLIVAAMWLIPDKRFER
jgi:uncharacterized membrane protein